MTFDDVLKAVAEAIAKGGSASVAKEPIGYEDRDQPGKHLTRDRLVVAWGHAALEGSPRIQEAEITEAEAEELIRNHGAIDRRDPSRGRVTVEA